MGEIATRVEQFLRKQRLPSALPEFRRPPGAYGPDFFLLEVLYRAVRKARPRAVVEFGSGWTTYVIAKALETNRAGFLHSIDAEPHWAGVTQGMVSHLSQWCDVRNCQTEPVEIDGTRLLRHVGAPTSADFILVDGPNLQNTEAIGAADPLTMGASTILFDKRERNARWLAAALGREAELVPGWADKSARVYRV
jgi:predicted O-methyltransferase YrrM